MALTPTGSAFATTTPLSWGYNGRGELTAATRSGNTAFERAYQYDGIGNRLFSETSGSQISDPAGPNTTAYTPNALNQYSSITLNSPPSTLNPSHDDDGNMTSGPVPGANGLLPGVPVPANATLTWDAENRLVKAVVNGTTVHYDYDHLSRLISRGVGVSPATFTHYLYDGWNRIAEYESNGTGHTLKSTYLWGMDLSGTMQGAGGVGGLLSMTLNSQPSPLNYYPTYDGNGNISEYVDDNGDKVAHFEYDPFGNLTVDSENNAGDFSYRFSTKPQDATTGLYYYGYRYYDPSTGRWPSRDPIQERGGSNLYGFLGNDGINQWDYLGFAKGVFRVAMKGWLGVDPSDGSTRKMHIFSNQFTKNIFNSTDQNGAMKSIISHYDLNGDGRLTEKDDCPPWRVKLVGYSWGAASVLNVASDLGKKVENPDSNLFVAVGTVDPVTTARGKLPGKPKWVKDIYNVYQTNGIWRGPTGSLAAGLFKGQSVPGATNFDKSSYKYSVGNYYYHATKPWDDHISIQRYATDVVNHVKSVVLNGEK